MRRFVLIILFSVLGPLGATADEIDNLYIAKARNFVVKNPMLARSPQTPRDLVVAALRIEGIKNLVQLYRRGVLPGDLKTQLDLRLDHHFTVSIGLVNNADPIVSGLAGHVRAHARVAWFVLRGGVHPTPYGYVADLAVSHGRYLAARVAAKYAPGENLIPPPPKIEQW